MFSFSTRTQRLKSSLARARDWRSFCCFVGGWFSFILHFCSFHLIPNHIFFLLTVHIWTFLLLLVQRVSRFLVEAAQIYFNYKFLLLRLFGRYFYLVVHRECSMFNSRLEENDEGMWDTTQHSTKHCIVLWQIKCLYTLLWQYLSFYILFLFFFLLIVQPKTFLQWCVVFFWHEGGFREGFNSLWKGVELNVKLPLDKARHDDEMGWRYLD